MHRRWLSLPLLTSCATAFYPYHQTKDDNGMEQKRFVPFEQLPEVTQDDIITMDIKKISKRDNAFPVVISNKVSQPNAMAVSQDGSDYSYFSTFKFGSKGQNMYMLIDTGSANTWVMGQDCTSKACSIHNLFGKADSTTLNTSSNSKWSLTYGTGQVAGVVASDTVSFANFTFNMGFGLATTASDDFNNYPMDGILGLGRATSNQLGTPTAMETLGKQGKLAGNVVGVHLNRAADATKDGEISFGGVDTTKFSGSISYTQTSNVASWEIPVDDAYVNGNACNFVNKKAVIDTGTSYVLMPPADAQTLHNLIPGSSQAGETFTVPCDTTANVQVTFSGVKYSISPKDYVGKTSGTTNVCTTNIIGHQAFGPDEWILGDVFLKNVYTVFDFDQGRIGFAMPGSGGIVSSPASSSTSSGSSSSSALPSTMITSMSASLSASATPTSSLSSSSTVIKTSATATSSSNDIGNPFDVNGASATKSSTTSSTSTARSASSRIESTFSLLYLMMFAFMIGIII